MVNRLSSVFTLLALCLFAALPVAGQQLDRDDLARFQLAEKYLSGGQFEQAIILLEELHEAHPDAYIFFEKLASAYENSKQYDDAVALVDERLETAPAPRLLTQRAHLLYLDGQEQAAFDAWDMAVAQAPEEQGIYQTVSQSLIDHRLFDRAIAVLEQGRATLGRPGLFRLSLAYLNSLTGDHKLAMIEYLGLLREDKGKLGLVKSRMMNFGDDSEVLQSYISATGRAAEAHPQQTALRELLAWLHLQAENHKQALDATLAVVQVKDEGGGALLAFARQVADAEAFAVAAQAYEEIRARYPGSPYAAPALYELAALHEAWAQYDGERAVDAQGQRRDAPHFEEAAALYRSFLQDHPRHAHAADALQHLGSLQMEEFRRLAQADATLGKVVEQYPSTEAAFPARLNLAGIALARGQLERGRLLLARLVDETASTEDAQSARYQLALLHFYQADFEAAQALLKVINTNTSTDAANNAISLRVLIYDNAGPDSTNAVLTAFASARLLQARRLPHQAIDAYEEILAQHGRHPVADEARFFRAEALLDYGAVDEAFQAYMEIPLMHPRSTRADRSLYRAAAIQQTYMDDAQAASEIYLRILTDYPGSLLTSQVREHIQALRGSGV